MPTATPAKGEVWKIEHVRKGPLTIRLLEDVASAGDFFEAEIVEGRAQFASAASNYAQRFEGHGTPGSVLTMRTTLVRFLSKVTT